MSTKTVVNPWTWQDAQGWTWGIEVENARRTLYTAGQVPMDEHGHVLHTGDMRGQLIACLDHLERVLAERDYTLADVVRIDYYTTDTSAVVEQWDAVSSRLGSAGCRAGGVLLGVTALAVPGLMIEIQAIAVR